jgi:hypothetical protein
MPANLPGRSAAARVQVVLRLISGQGYPALCEVKEAEVKEIPSAQREQTRETSQMYSERANQGNQPNVL